MVELDLGGDRVKRCGRVEKGGTENKSRTHGKFCDGRLQEKRAEVS